MSDEINEMIRKIGTWMYDRDIEMNQMILDYKNSPESFNFSQDLFFHDETRPSGKKIGKSYDELNEDEQEQEKEMFFKAIETIFNPKVYE